MPERNTSTPTALRHRLPLASRSVLARLRRRPPDASVVVWTRKMSAIAAAALGLSVWLMFTVDPLTVDAVRAHWRTAIVPLLASVTDLGKSEWYLVPAGLAVIALALADWTSRRTRARARLSYVFGQSAYLFAAVAVSGILVNIVKLVVGRARPLLFDDVGPLHFQPFQFDYSNLSYPSGHSTTVGAVALVLMLWFPRLRLPIFLVTGLVAFSRVAALAHYPGDVVAGYAFGFLLSLWLARWLAARGLVFRVAAARFLPVPRHRFAWRRFLRSE